jgi:hypothetical protein
MPFPCHAVPLRVYNNTHRPLILISKLILCIRRIRKDVGKQFVTCGSDNGLSAVASEDSEGRMRWTDAGNGYKGGSYL